MRIMAEQVRRFDGTVAQLIGDELLAFFGAPVSYDDDSERAVRAALAIQRSIAQYAEEVEDAYGIDLAVRIGLNTGPVIVGAQRDGQDGYDPGTRSARRSTWRPGCRKSPVKAAS